MAYWLLKTEPESFGYDDLVRAKREGWDGIRNYQARIFLRQMQRGDQVIIYHSNAKPPGAAGIAKIVGTAEPDPTQFDPESKYYDPASDPSDPRWDWVTVAPVRKLRFVSLDAAAGDAGAGVLTSARPWQPPLGDPTRRARVRRHRPRRHLTIPSSTWCSSSTW